MVDDSDFGLLVSPSLDTRHASLAAEPAEPHLRNIRQLTFGGQNAEAYFSFDGTKLIFQSTNNWSADGADPVKSPSGARLGCYQMYVMD